ncbi:MAG: DegV family protein [Clostridia bacterium]|nr:DegV family protein [Clostridia bacterium]
MSSFVIIPDASCDLTRDLRERFDIPEYLHGHITFPDGHDEVCSLDWESISATEYFRTMSEDKAIYKTAGVGITEAETVFEKYLSQGIDVLNITLSSGISSTYSYCKKAADNMQEKYPDRRVICIDSLRYSTSLSLLVILAATKKAEGASIDEVAEYIEEKKHCIHQMGPMDDLFFLVRTGRISNAKAFFGSLVGINPMADFNERGVSEVLAKFKGKKAALDATVKYMKGTVTDPENQIIFVAHSNRPEAAEKLRAMIEAEFHPKEIIINSVGMACGANIGPGLCAAFYEGKPISPDMADEKALMDSIAQKK